jgi:hypothetical protein
MIGALPLVNLPWSVAAPMYSLPCVLNLTSILSLVEPVPPGFEAVVVEVPPPVLVETDEAVPGRHWEYPRNIREVKLIERPTYSHYGH